MIEWDAAQVAAAAGAQVVHTGSGPPTPSGVDTPGPSRVSIDSRSVQPGDLFVGLPGERVDGGAYAAQALSAGAWGVLVRPAHVESLEAGSTVAPAGPADVPGGSEFGGGAVLAHPNPLVGLQSLAHAWRRALGEQGAQVVAVTGSTGKTSTKDILATLLRGAEAELGGPTVASPANLNTEIGLPLAVLAAPRGTRAVVLEMAMRGRGQIAQLTAIAEPEVGVIVNVGPVHLQQLGSLEAVAAAKAELIAGMAPGATAVVPAGEPLLAVHLREDLQTVTFGEGGDVELVERREDGQVTIIDHAAGEERIVLRPSFAQSHNLRNLLAAVAAARALGVTPAGRLEVRVLGAARRTHRAGGGIVLINDCYNANPMSMRAALDDLAASARARRVAVLGDMLELGPEGRRLHREIGAYARARGVELLVAVGRLAGEVGEGFEGEVHCVPDAAEAAETLCGTAARGRLRARQGLARGRLGAGRRDAGGCCRGAGVGGGPLKWAAF